jgi:hypothetical protein
MRTIGSVPSLLEMAAKWELDLRRFDAALARYDAAAAQSANPAYWLARKADAAEQAGRTELASQTRRAAIVAIESLPDARRHTVAMTDLEGRLRQALSKSHPEPGTASK